MPVSSSFQSTDLLGAGSLDSELQLPPRRADTASPRIVSTPSKMLDLRPNKKCCVWDGSGSISGLGVLGVLKGLSLRGLGASRCGLQLTRGFANTDDLKTPSRLRRKQAHGEPHGRNLSCQVVPMPDPATLWANSHVYFRATSIKGRAVVITGPGARVLGLRARGVSLQAYTKPAY